MYSVDIFDFEYNLNEVFRLVYSFAYALIPDELQASQICIDSVSGYLLNNKSYLIDKLKKQNNDLNHKEIQLEILKLVYNLCERRINHQLEISFERYVEFSELKFREKVILILREKFKFRLFEIEYITNLRSYQIINLDETAKNHLKRIHGQYL